MYAKEEEEPRSDSLSNPAAFARLPINRPQPVWCLVGSGRGARVPACTRISSLAIRPRHSKRPQVKTKMKESVQGGDTIHGQGVDGHATPFMQSPQVVGARPPTLQDLDPVTAASPLVSQPPQSSPADPASGPFGAPLPASNDLLRDATVRMICL